MERRECFCVAMEQVLEVGNAFFFNLKIYIYFFNVWNEYFKFGINISSNLKYILQFRMNI